MANNDLVDETEHHGRQIMPFYIICDCSGSMSGDLPTLRDHLEKLVQEVARNELAGDLCMLSIITFGSDAKTVVPLQSAEEIGALSPLGVMGSTNFEAAIREYATRSKDDVARLKADGNKVFRPCVFFLTDGYPDSPAEGEPGWKATFDTLVGWDPRGRHGNSNYPYVVAYGYRDAKEETLKTLAYPNFGEKTGRWYLAKTHDVGVLVTSMIGTIGQTILTSVATAVSGKPQLLLPSAQSTPTFLAGLPDLLT